MGYLSELYQPHCDRKLEWWLRGIIPKWLHFRLVTYSKCSLYSIFTYIWVIYGVNVRKYSSTMEHIVICFDCNRNRVSCKLSVKSTHSYPYRFHLLSKIPILFPKKTQNWVIPGPAGEFSMTKTNPLMNFLCLRPCFTSPWWWVASTGPLAHGAVGFWRRMAPSMLSQRSALAEP
jgi:hypothetical protein